MRAHEAIDRVVRGFFKRPVPIEAKTFWAVKDCSFDVCEGEAVALLGANGAGKSVLLKMLARVVKPTCGAATICGRLTAVLGLGSGFHPDMTGRENVLFNGAILGMRRAEMERKLDEIVAFAGVEDFLDMPVKHYSSGMYMRLAFSIAAHVEADVLLVDEALAVGDAAFRQKCMERMRRVTRQGATVLIVSHELSVLSELCTRGIFLEHGQLSMDGSVADAVDRYRNCAVPIHKAAI
jgi:lipopolysaccharide transport system ATP-binding protein